MMQIEVEYLVTVLYRTYYGLLSMVYRKEQLYFWVDLSEWLGWEMKPRFYHQCFIRNVHLMSFST